MNNIPVQTAQQQPYTGFPNANGYSSYAAAPNTPDEDKIEKLLLLITWVSIFNCIMKMDYNAAIYLFLYYLWTKKEHNQHYKAFFYANIAFLACDLLWFFANMGSWSGKFQDEEEKYSVWLSFRGYRIFSLIICVIIMILKIVLVYFQSKVLPKTAPSANINAGPVSQNLNAAYPSQGQNYNPINQPGQQGYNGQQPY